MSRYRLNTAKQLDDGRVVFRSRIGNKIPKSDRDVYIVTQTGDRLDTIAYQFLGDQSLWYIIAKANNIHDPSFAVEDGTTLRIPANYTNYLNL
jgi:prophage DNA circulation protein